MLPLARGVPWVGRTWIGVAPPIVNVPAAVLAEVTVTVIVVAVMAAGELAAKPAPVTTTSGAEPVLNSKPLGIVKTKSPTAISPADPSVITIAVRVVHAPPKSSAEIAPSPPAGVTVTVAAAGLASARMRKSAITTGIPILITLVFMFHPRRLGKKI